MRRERRRRGARYAVDALRALRLSRCRSPLCALTSVRPVGRSVGLCPVGALSVFCRDSVGTLSGLCRLTTVGALSASVGLCRPLSTDPDRYYVCTVSTSVGLSRLCQRLSVCHLSRVSLSAAAALAVVVDLRDLGPAVVLEARPGR